MGGLRMQGPRVNLRPIRAGDIPLIEALRSGSQDSEALVITRAGEDSPIGLLQFRTDMPSEGWVTIEDVALTEEVRRWGLGQEAVRVFEQDAVDRGLRHFATSIDPGQGLGLYFWLRLGYRPLDTAPNSQGSDLLQMVRHAGGG